MPIFSYQSQQRLMQHALNHNLTSIPQQNSLPLTPHRSGAVPHHLQQQGSAPSVLVPDSLQVSFENGKLNGSALLKGVTPDQVLDLLTNYEEYPQIFKREISVSKEIKNGEVHVDHLIDAGLKKISYKLKMENETNEHGSKILKWTMISSNLLGKLEGKWMMTGTGIDSHLTFGNCSELKNKWIQRIINPSIIIDSQKNTYKEIALALS